MSMKNFPGNSPSPIQQHAEFVLCSTLVMNMKKFPGNSPPFTTCRIYSRRGGGGGGGGCY